MKKSLFSFVLFAVFLSSAPAFGAAVPVGASLKLGTLGFGADVTVGLSEKFNARIGVGFLNFDADFGGDDEDDGDGGDDGCDCECRSNGGDAGEADNSDDSGGGSIKTALRLRSVAFLADWHPAAGGLRISAGLVYNENKLTMDADTSGEVEIGDHEYSLSEFRGTVDFRKLSPYLGIGYGNAVGKGGRWNFAFDIGLMFQGSPRVDMRATASDPSLQAALDGDVAAEEHKMEDDLSFFTYYPVLAFGVSYRF